MENLCHTLLTMTLASSVAALAVMGLRLVLKGAPRRYILMLWMCVLIRMISPFGIGPGFVSLIPEPVTSGRAAEVILDRNRTAPAQAGPVTGSPARTGETSTENAVQASAQEIPSPAVTPCQVIGAVWLVGLAGMLLWTSVSYGRIRKRVSEAVMTEPDVYESDRIDTPFVLGGNIYLPAGLTEPDRRYVLLHEQAHIKRYDPAFKVLAWLALAVHWFNPVLWLAYRLFCRDIETVCDIQVLEGFDPENRREDTAGYAAALLHLGRRERLPQTVLPFGEENAGGRIKNVLKYKRPAKWVLVLMMFVFSALCVVLMTDAPAQEETVEMTEAINQARGLLLDGHPVDAVTIGVPRYGRGSQMVDFPEELTRELVSVLQAHPHEDFRPATEEDRQSDNGSLIQMAGTGDMVYLLWDGAAEGLYVFSNGLGVLFDGRTQQIALIPGLGTADDFSAWQDHAGKWLTEDWPREVYAKCTDPVMNSWSREDRLRTVLALLGFDLVLNEETPVDSWKNGVLRLNLARLTLGDDGAAAADLVQNCLGGVCRLLRTALTDVDRVVFVTKDGVELTVDLSGSAQLGEEGFAELFNSGAGAPLNPDSSGTGAWQTEIPASVPAQNTAQAPTGGTNRKASPQPSSPPDPPDPAADLLDKQTTVRRAGPGRDPAGEVRDLFFTAGAGRYLSEDNALVYVQNNEIKVLLTEDARADARELTRAANLTLALTDGSDTFRVYDTEGNAVVDTYGDREVMAAEDLRAMLETETGEPRPSPGAQTTLEPETVTVPQEPAAPVPPQDLPDSLDLDFAAAGESSANDTNNEGVG